MEGPSLVILKEELRHLRGVKVTEASGTAGIDMTRITGKTIRSIRSFGKHFLIQFSSFTIRIHFLMFGSYRINDRRDRPERLRILAGEDEINFYSCSVSFLEGDLNEIYDWSADVMSTKWDPGKARRKLKRRPQMNVGDALLDQSIFAGVGNIIKNEVLYRIRVHPATNIGSLPAKILTEMISDARHYSFEFYRWKKIFQLRKHWQIYKKKKCRRCDLPVQLKHTGATPRRTFFCESCQVLYEK